MEKKKSLAKLRTLSGLKYRRHIYKYKMDQINPAGKNNAPDTFSDIQELTFYAYESKANGEDVSVFIMVVLKRN